MFTVVRFLEIPEITILFSFLILALIMWQLHDISQRICHDYETSRMWAKIFWVGVLFAAPLSFHLSLKLTERSHLYYSPLVILFIYSAPFIFNMLSSAGLNEESIYSEIWGWVKSPGKNIFTTVEYVWNILLAWSTLFLLFSYAMKHKQYRAKFEQILLIATGFTIIIATTTLTQIVYPLLTLTHEYPIASSISFIIPFSIIIGFNKYRAVDFSPFYASGELFKAINEGVMIVDNNDIIQYANTSFCQLTGYTLQEIVEKKAAHLFLDKPDYPLINQVIEQRKRKMNSQYEVRLRAKNGNKLWVQINGSPYFDHNGNIIGSIGVHKDISLEKELEQQLKESKNRFRLLVKTAKDAIIMVDDSFRIISWNNGASRIFGYDKAETIKQPAYMLFPEDQKERHLNFMRKLLPTLKKGQKEASSMECEAKRKNGERFLIEFTVNTWEKSGKIFYCGFIRDITRRKEIENRLIEKNKELNLFLYRATHDLKGPLSSTKGLINLIKSKQLSSEKDLFEMLGLIDESTDHLIGIIENLSIVTKISRGKPVKEIIDFKELLDSLMNSIRYMEGFDQVDFDMNIQLDRPVSVNPHLIRAVLLNLITNAVKYRNANKGAETKISITACEVLESEHNHPFIEIKIKDSGVGMSREILEKSFDMFYRGHENSSGSGLGLYIVKTAIDKLGGSISVESEHGKGTEFLIRIPGENRKLIL